jgi:Uma2 family endonuclease
MLCEATVVARAAFHANYPEPGQCEFINGAVAIQPPTTWLHACTRGNFRTLLNVHVRSRRLGSIAGPDAMVSLSENDFEPDVCFWRGSRYSLFGRDQVRFPAPDWIAEVLSPSTERIDRGVKFEDYAAHGVAEYWIVDADKQTVEQYTLIEGSYQLLLKSGNGTIRSEVIAGFEIPIIAIFDDAENLRVLKALLE